MGRLSFLADLETTIFSSSRTGMTSAEVHPTGDFTLTVHRNTFAPPSYLYENYQKTLTRKMCSFKVKYTISELYSVKDLFICT